MKTILTLFCIILFQSCFLRAQVPDEPVTLAEYPSFYNSTVQKLNIIIPQKSNYYGQPLSLFLNALNQNNLVIKSYDPGPFNNKMLSFGFIWNHDTKVSAWKNNYADIMIRVYFQQPYNYQQISTMMSTDGYYSYWNPQAENFFKNLIIEKIEFWYVNGLTDKTSPPK